MDTASRKTQSALPSQLEMKHSAYSKNHKQKDRPQSGEAQIHLSQRNLVPSNLKQKQYSWLFF
jgi:hypothetical protein